MLLRRCVDSLLRADIPPSCILVIDNAPADDETRRVAVESGVLYVCEPTPGRLHARRKAVDSSQGEVIAFIDDDTEVASTWLGPILEAFTDPSVGCVTGRVIPRIPMNRVQRAYTDFAIKLDGVPRRYKASDFESTFFPGAIGIGANMAFRREVTVTIQPFATVPGISSAEEDVAFYQLVRAGWQLQYAPEAVLTIEHRSGLWSQMRRLYEYGYCTVLVIHSVFAEGNLRLNRQEIRKDSWGALRRVVSAVRHGSPLQFLFAVSYLTGNIAAVLVLPLSRRQHSESVGRRIVR
jgi:cellulose synthase/poly-beta-1,6-N-acetylglucosamine synthase-like glycosyltransferase